MLTQERLKEVLSYDPETGIFTWKECFLLKRLNSRYSGKRAGHENKAIGGYREIGIDNNKYLEHRLVILYMTGSFPVFDVDHIDGDSSNNKYSNIRPATTTQNTQNKKIQKNNKCGYKGVFLHKETGKYRARIRVNKKNISLGLFHTPIDAHEAYCNAAIKYFKEFSNDGNTGLLL